MAAAKNREREPRQGLTMGHGLAQKSGRDSTPTAVSWIESQNEKTGDEPGRREPIEEPAVLVSSRRTGPMRKSQHRRRSSPSGADPRTAQRLSQLRRAVRERQRLGRSACGGRDVGKRKEPKDAIVRTHGEPRQRRGIQLTDGDAASGEDETREPRRASGEHTQRTDSANEMKTRDASGGALREKMVRKSTARNPRLAAARLLRARQP
jgi:hypothetical protein